MVVMTLERVPNRLRGLLSRWLIEIQTGVYVGKVSGLVREHLWERALKECADGRVTLAWSTASDQGFSFRIHGDERRRLVDMDGMTLVAIKSLEK